MKIILTQNVPGLGALGDELKVKPGYARNYLIPKGFAISAASSASKELEHHKRYLEKLRKDAIEKASELAEALKQVEFEITQKAGPNGRLFGSVTNRDLEATLGAMGYEINRRDIMIPEPIKTVGSHAVTLKLHSEVRVELSLKVKGEVEVLPESTEDALGEDVSEEEISEDLVDAASTEEVDAEAEVSESAEA